MERAGIDPDVASALQEHMKDSSTYVNSIDPPGCLMAKLKLRADDHSTICVATTHITWKEFKYPILQMLQVMIKRKESYQCRVYIKQGKGSFS